MGSIVRAFLDDVARAVAGVKALKPEEAGDAFIVHHAEADGLCSAAVVKGALEREGFTVKTLCLEKLFPEVLEKLHSKRGRVYVYTDIGAAHAGRVSSLNQSKNLTIILDHHDTEPSTDPRVYNLNPELHGLSGEKEASGATVAYLFSRSLNPANQGYAHLALIGSAEIPGPVKGLNREAVDDALRNRLVTLRRTKSGEEDFTVLALGKPLSYKRYAVFLSVLGSVGYYRGGSEIGVEACLRGFSSEAEEAAEKFEAERSEVNRRLLERLRLSGLNQLRHTQWFHAYDNFQGMGTKVIGSFCSYLRFQRFINPMKYLIGIMNMSPLIPGFGQLGKDYVKVSARAPDSLSRAIEKGEKPSLSKLLPEACQAQGGFGDGHSVAASGVFLRGREKHFIESFESLLD